MEKIIAIVGQTATGKSDFAVELAEALAVNGAISEVISADSRQVYKGLNIGTGKITRKEMRGIPHHLLDVANPKRQYTVADYTRDAKRAIAKIIKKGRVPIICGGTGFYIDALLKGMEYPDVPPNKKLRATLAKRSTAELFSMLRSYDKERARTIDPKNAVRLIRAIEIATYLGTVPKTKAAPQWQSLTIGFSLPRPILKEKIIKRLDTRIRGGMLAEARRLHAKGLSYARMEALGLEYRYQARYLQRKITKAEMTEQLANEIFQYAKRQETWFKRDKAIIWVDPRKKSERKKARKIITAFLKA